MKTIGKILATLDIKTVTNHLKRSLHPNKIDILLTSIIYKIKIKINNKENFTNNSKK